MLTGCNAVAVNNSIDSLNPAPDYMVSEGAPELFDTRLCYAMNDRDKQNPIVLGSDYEEPLTGFVMLSDSAF